MTTKNGPGAAPQLRGRSAAAGRVLRAVPVQTEHLPEGLAGDRGAARVGHAGPGRHLPAGPLQAGSLRVDEVVLASFLRVHPKETALLALDWQHPAHRFWPHRLSGASEWLDSPFSPFPDGDYYIFLTEDMSQGTFGHPWEQTLCVWGDDLVRDLVPELDLPVQSTQR